MVLVVKGSGLCEESTLEFIDERGVEESWEEMRSLT